MRALTTIPLRAFTTIPLRAFTTIPLRACTAGGWAIPTAKQHNIFDSEKLKRFSCAAGEIKTGAFRSLCARERIMEGATGRALE